MCYQVPGVPSVSTSVSGQNGLYEGLVNIICACHYRMQTWCGPHYRQQPSNEETRLSYVIGEARVGP